MKKFCINIVIFIILLIAGAFAVDFILETGFKKARTDELSTWNDIFDSKINSDVIISGNSRAVFHFNTAILDSVLNVNSYNLGIDGYRFNMQYIRFRFLEKYNKAPKLIIQNVDFFTLYPDSLYLYNKKQFFPYLHKPLLKKALREMGMSEYELHIPALQYYSDFRTIKNGLLEFFNLQHFAGQRYKGHQGNAVSWNGSELNKILSNDSITATIEPKIAALFDSFLQECKEKNIQVILVFAPEYIKMTEFTKSWNEKIQVYYDLAEKYDIPFLNYTHDSLCYDTAYFYNAMHLNKKGSELFSLKLANDIKEQNLYKN
ncbi:MAG: hypothetical protein LBV75_06090 [Paludibacter sp.]|jgi:hypothetical protein|nr:hypothetical protein [Paludibacter sp.]